MESEEISNTSESIPVLDVSMLDDGLMPSSTNPSSNMVIISAQTYQNYKSELKWWHCYENASMDKIGYIWPVGMDDALIQAVKNIPHTNMGCDRNDIGTHSNIKFAESKSVSRVDGPSRTQVCLRTGHTVGKTQDCYMFCEEDGDSLVGRTVAQLKFNADESDV